MRYSSNFAERLSAMLFDALPVASKGLAYTQIVPFIGLVGFSGFTKKKKLC